MPRACSVCTSPQASDITKALMDGDSLRRVQERYGCSHMAAGRHLRRCLHVRRAQNTAKEPALHAEPVITPGTERFDTNDPKTLVATTARLVDEALALLEHAKRKDDQRTALAALREARDGLSLLMRVAGMLASDGAVNVTIDKRLQVALFEKLDGMDKDALRAYLARPLPVIVDQDPGEKHASTIESEAGANDVSGP